MSSSITAAQVKELRELTGAGMMDAKQALTEADGDMNRAADILRQKGIATAAKKSGRAAAEGLVQSAVAADNRVGALIEVNCETDFVARGEAFGGLAQTLAEAALAQGAATVEGFLAQPAADGRSIQELLTEKIGQIKENISVRRLVRYDGAETGYVQAYVHTGGKIGVLVHLQVGKVASRTQAVLAQLAKDVAMQIASAAPEFVRREEIPASVIEAEKQVEMGKEDILSKPENIREKIVMGRVDKLLAQRVLLEQPFVKDPAKTIDVYVQEVAKQLGDTVQVMAFTRYVLGEGLQKREDNFAQEVMAAAGVK
jgi:elongation factor Ts